MSVKNKILSPLQITFLVTGILFIIFFILSISPEEMIFVGIVDLLAFSAIYVEKFKLYRPFIKIGVSVFNIIIFAYQIYGAFTFSNIGYSFNVILTMVLSFVFLTAYIISILFYSKI